MKKKDFKIHDTAIVDEGASIGSGTNIWHWSHISSGAKIGENCSIGQNVFIGNQAKVGHNVKIQNNVSIYDNVVIEDSVFCGPSMVFTNVINPRAEVSRKNEYLFTHVCKGATLGANCTIICGVKIGSYAFIGAGSVVTKDIKAYALVVGVPAIQIGWMSAYGDKIPLDLDHKKNWICPITKSIYTLKDGILTKEII